MADKNDTDKKNLSDQMDDVARPGKTPANPTSRPVIVGHRPMLHQDPMVSKTDESEESSVEDTGPKKKSGFGTNTIQPSEEAKEEARDAKEKEEIEEKVDDEKVNQDDQLSGSSSAAVDALAGEVNAKREAEKASEAELKKQAELEEVIQSHKYFVPIGEVSKRRMNFIILGLLVFALLVVVAVNFAIDADLLDIGLQPLTDLL
jgi:hypothetical protein